MRSRFNLFAETQALTNSRENHLTAFFAALLLTDEETRRAYASLVLSAFAKESGWVEPVIRDVETQVSYARLDETNRPDMRLQLADGHIILCEHKIDAVETEMEGRQLQLERYLGLPNIDGLVYVRSKLKQPSATVLQNRLYIKPNHVVRSHFLWSDFYRIIDPNTVLGGWICDAFEKMDFTPPDPVFGDLAGDMHDPIVLAARKNFAKKVECAVGQYARDNGWTVELGSTHDHYFYLAGGGDSRDGVVFVNAQKGSSLRIKVTPPRLLSVSTVRHDIQELINLQANVFRGASLESAENASRANGRRSAVLVKIPLANFSSAATTEEQQDRLVKCLLPLLTLATPFLRSR